jgi:hypothetical protein
MTGTVDSPPMDVKRIINPVQIHKDSVKIVKQKGTIHVYVWLTCWEDKYDVVFSFDSTVDCSVQLFWGVNQQVWFDNVLNMKAQPKVEKEKKEKKKKIVTSSALVLENEIENDREILLVSYII